jgi:hypothetical protein
MTKLVCDLFQPDPERQSNHDVEEKSLEARDLLDNHVLQEAFNDIYSRAVGTLLESEVGSLTAGAAHATIKSITDLLAQLEQYIADHKVRQKYNKGDK